MLKGPPYVAGEIERSKGTHPAVIARGPLGGGDALRNGGAALGGTAQRPELFRQLPGGHGPGIVSVDGKEPLRQRRQDLQHTVHVLIRHDGQQEHELLIREQLPQAVRCGGHALGVVAAVQQEHRVAAQYLGRATGRRQSRPECSAP